MDKEILTNKEFLKFLLQIFSSTSFYKFMIFLIFVLYAIPIGKTIYKIVDFLLNYQKRKLEIMEAEKEKNKIEVDKIEKEKMFESIKYAIDQVKSHNELIETILKSLQLSPSNYKYEILLESFLGIDRSFSNDIKSKILYYIENGKKDKYIYIKKEIQNSFKEKVLNKLSLFIFNDVEYMNTIYEKSREKLEIFLNKFDSIDFSNDAKSLLEDEKEGLIPVLMEIQQDIALEYYHLFGIDPSIDYLKRKQ